MRLHLHTRERSATDRLERREPNWAGEGAPGVPAALPSRAACGYVALCLCAFALTAVAMRPLSSAETRPLGIAKLEGFLREIDRYDVVAVGNSRVYRQIVPDVLERELARRGVAASAYNLGASSMSFDELAYLLREISAARPERLRWVLIDLTIGLQFAAETTDVLQLLLGAMPFGAQLEARARSLQYDFNRFASREEGPEMLRRGRRALRGQPAPARYSPDGFSALDEEELPTYQARRRRLLGSLDEYRNQVEALTRKRGVLLPYSRRQAALVQRLAASVREAGAEPVFLMPPSFRPALFFADSDRYRVLRYHDPARFPELFELEHRFDLKHLNREGAEIYTRMLARDLVSGSEG